MKPHDHPLQPDPMDRMGHHLASLLSESNQPLSHDVTERLRVARQQALSAHQLQMRLRPSVVPQGSSLALSDPPGTGHVFWRGLASAIPLVALIAGLVAVQWFDVESTVAELAEIDAALLVDDLPPAAYSDPGFMQFLRQQAVKTENQH